MEVNGAFSSLRRRTSDFRVSVAPDECHNTFIDESLRFLRGRWSRYVGVNESLDARGGKGELHRLVPLKPAERREIPKP